jgi:uncharacterized membrane protein HdeD (DUF308 family)
MPTQVAMYLTYLVICLPLTVVVGATLYTNGRVFLVEMFGGREEIADAINHLLIVGFYLLTIGFVLLTLSFGGSPNDPAELIRALSIQIGLVMLVLGVVHMFNLRLLSSTRRKFQQPNSAQAPAPTTEVPITEPALATNA